MKNMGIPPEMIAEHVIKCCADVRYWIESDVHDWLERAVRFHLELVRIHPFTNGNGRHARLAADLLLLFHGRRRLIWSSGDDLRSLNVERGMYIEGVKAAIDHDFDPLLAYVRNLQPDQGA